MIKALLERLADADGGFLFPVSGLFLCGRVAAYPGGSHPPGSSPLSCCVLPELHPGLLLRSSSRDGPGRYGTAASCPMRFAPYAGRLLSHVRGCFYLMSGDASGMVSGFLPKNTREDGRYPEMMPEPPPSGGRLLLSVSGRSGKKTGGDRRHLWIISEGGG